METSKPPEIKPEVVSSTSKKREEDRKGGLWASLLSKLGLGGAETGAGAGVGGGLLATKAGLLALILAGTTVAAGIGLVGRSMMSTGGRGGEGAFSVFSDAASHRADGSGGSGAAAGSAAGKSGEQGASSSLDYFAQANKGPDAANPASDGTVPGAGAADASSDKAVPDNANAPANVGGGKPQLAKSTGFGGASASGGGFAPRLAPQAGAAGGIGGGFQPLNRNAGTSAFSRNKTSGMSGRGGLQGVRSRKAVGQAIDARNTGRQAQSNRSTGMQAAGTTFDGGNSGIAGSEAGVPQAGAGPQGGEGGPHTPASNIVPQNQVPQPPPVGDTENATPYQWAMYMAMAALGVALLSFMILNMIKKQMLAALAEPPPFNAGHMASLLMMAKLVAGIATAAGAVATMMGVMIMTTYGQMMQGMMFTGIGALITFQAAQKLMQLFNLNFDALKKETDPDKFKKLAEEWTKKINSAFEGGGFGGLFGGK